MDILVKHALGRLWQWGAATTTSPNSTLLLLHLPWSALSWLKGRSSLSSGAPARPSVLSLMYTQRILLLHLHLMLEPLLKCCSYLRHGVGVALLLPELSWPTLWSSLLLLGSAYSSTTRLGLGRWGYPWLSLARLHETLLALLLELPVVSHLLLLLQVSSHQLSELWSHVGHVALLSCLHCSLLLLQCSHLLLL